jgi:hypothetical protein
MSAMASCISTIPSATLLGMSKNRSPAIAKFYRFAGQSNNSPREPWTVKRTCSKRVLRF